MALQSHLRQIILKEGYLTIDELMKQILTENTNSYYRKDGILGEKGDFITSPEISQLFGEIIGLWTIEQWYKLNKPKIINIVELGPGRGLLMRDLLRVAKLVPEFYNSIQIELIEINPYFKGIQKNNLNQFDLKIKWLEKAFDISTIPSIIITNEFFDALPTKQYLKFKEKWYEVVVVVDEKDNSFKFDKREIDAFVLNELNEQHTLAKNDAIVEKSIYSFEIIKFISQHIKTFSGASLIIDYGYNVSLQERKSNHYAPTLQAIKKNKYHNLLGDLGEADWSSHVDFAALKKVALENKIKKCDIISQRDFLVQYGILLRSNNLKNDLPLVQAEIIERQVERLISPSQMGELFKVMILSN